MKTKTIIPALVLVLVLLATLSCKSAEPEPTAEDNKMSSTQTGQVDLSSESDDDLAEKYKDNPALFQAALYAREEGVSLDEAVQRFELMEEAGPLQSTIEENEAETYAGSWIQHQPEFKLVFAFTENGEETMKKYITEDSPLAGLIELRTFDMSYKELCKAQQDTMQLLEELGLFFSSSVNVQENQVEVYVTDFHLFNDALKRAGENLPDHVVAIVVYEPLNQIPTGINPDSSVHFPQLKTRSGSFMDALMVGELTLQDGYLRVGDNLIIWQPDYFVNNNKGTIEVLDRDGKVVGRVSEEIVMGGGGAGTLENVNQLLKEPLPLDIKGLFWLQGTGTRLSLNFTSDLFNLEVVTSGEDKAYFLKKKPLLDEQAMQEITLTGKLVASYNGVLIKHPFICVEAQPEENKGTVFYTTFWPGDYKARINDGVFEIVDGSNNVVLRDGEEVEITGKVIYGYSEQLFEELPGGYSGPYLVVARLLN